MKSVFSHFTKLFIGFFCIGSCASSYLLYKLPENILEHSASINIQDLEQVDVVFLNLYIVLGATQITGLFAFTFMLMSRNSKSKNSGSNLAEQSNLQVETDLENEQEHGHTIDIKEIERLLDTDVETAEIFDLALSTVCNQLEASQAAAYVVKHTENARYIEMFAAYAHHIPEGESITYRFGEGIAGQVAKDGKPLNIQSVPDGYLTIVSGLGKATPKYLIVMPVFHEEHVVGVVEIASFKQFSSLQERDLNEAFGKLGLKLANNDNVSLEQAKL